MQRFTVLRDEGEGFDAEGQAVLRKSLQRGKRLAGQAPDFERALDALRVVRRDAMRAARVDFLELGVQRRPAAPRGISIDRGADLRIGLRQRVDARHQRAAADHRATHQQRNLVLAQDVHHGADRIGAPAPGRVAVVRIDEVDQVMRHFRARACVGLRGADVHAAVHLGRVHRHDLEGAARRELERKAGFAARRRPQQGVGGPRQG